MEIALFAGYETQQSFSVAFKAMFDYSPQALRKKRDLNPNNRYENRRNGGIRRSSGVSVTSCVTKEPGL